MSNLIVRTPARAGAQPGPRVPTVAHIEVNEGTLSSSELSKRVLDVMPRISDNGASDMIISRICDLLDLVVQKTTGTDGSEF